MLVLLVAMLADPVPRYDPLRQRMEQFCRSKPACVAKQQAGVREFLGVITTRRPPVAKTESCLGGATKGKLTDWTKAARCLRDWSKKPTPAPRRKSRP